MVSRLISPVKPFPLFQRGETSRSEAKYSSAQQGDHLMLSGANPSLHYMVESILKIITYNFL
jgi:hypothetical protein